MSACMENSVQRNQRMNLMISSCANETFERQTDAVERADSGERLARNCPRVSRSRSRLPSTEGC